MTQRDIARPAPFIGIGGLAVAVFLYGYSAFAVPSWLHSLVMPLLWLVLFVVGTRWFTRRPSWVPALAVLAFVAWFALMLLP